MLQSGNQLTSSEVKYFAKTMKDLEGEEDKLVKLYDDIICYTHRGKPIKPKTLGQKNYVQEISKNDIVFGIGPAGTGKTYLAMAMGGCLKEKK